MTKGPRCVAGFSLQVHAKHVEGARDVDRDAQFSYLNAQAADHLDSGCPVISVDTKKKELIGQFKNAGQAWRPAGDPVRVNVHDFKDPDLGTANPYGVFDVAANTGWVSVGDDHDTAAFAAETIRRWWQYAGIPSTRPPTGCLSAPPTSETRSTYSYGEAGRGYGGVLLTRKPTSC